jgi:pimeloyl-ACP methyl ester carboxylesterase
MAKSTPNASDYIVPINMNGLRGRMLRLPASRSSNNREFLVVYGHHAMLERWWGLVQNFNSLGNITMPDLPGFGGMDSFYKIGQKPTIDNLADYLAAFCKLRYKRRRFVIVGISFGFVVATRMLQRYPELAKKVDLIVSNVGFSHHDDFLFTKRRILMYRTIGKIISLPVAAWVFKKLFLNAWVLRNAYRRTHNARHKFAAAAAESQAMFDAVMETEVKLWNINDVRTHGFTTHEFLAINNTKVRVDVPVFHVGIKGDYYFNNTRVEQHFRMIFKDYTGMQLDLKGHAPSVVSSKKEAAVFVPPRVKKMLTQLLGES